MPDTITRPLSIQKRTSITATATAMATGLLSFSPPTCTTRLSLSSTFKGATACLKPISPKQLQLQSQTLLIRAASSSTTTDGPSLRRGFEGGQMPLYRRLPKLRGIAGGVRAQSLIAFARRGKHIPQLGSSNKEKKTTKKVPRKDVAAEEDFDEDAIEALFNLLEEDLKNDLSSEEGDDELTEEDLAKLEQELEEALGSDDEFSGMHDSSSEDTSPDDDSIEDADGEEDEEETPVVLRKWQLRRLASALKIGRRKTSIQSLAAELCLERAVVLELLRNPPPDLLLLSAALPDRVVETTSAPETKFSEQSNELHEEVIKLKPETETEPAGKHPIHVMQSRWSLQKRLKKVQVETLERVYNRTKRPTNAMISSVVHVTNLPRKRVIKWFEDKRAEDGIPYNRVPFERSTSENILTN